MEKEYIKIANCSGFYGDKLSAAKDLVEGGPIDVLTGDYLAELTMTILYSQKIKRGEDKGYVGTFLKQVKEIAETCDKENIKIVTNAGGLNPKSMANEIEKILHEQSLNMKVAYIDGDDLMPRMEELKKEGQKFNNIEKNVSIEKSGYMPLTSNAYLGAWGIKEALDLGADIVMHSATKFLAGHSDVILGLLALSNDELAEKLFFMQNSSGAICGPMDSFLTLRGIKTLHVRMQRHCENARVIANYLKKHDRVDNVYWPGFENHPNHNVAKSQMNDFGGMISFTVKGNFDAVSYTHLTLPTNREV